MVLTVAHLTHEPEDREHVKAMCQGCHLHYDKAHHAETAYRTRKERANTEDMFGMPSNAPHEGGVLERLDWRGVWKEASR